MLEYFTKALVLGQDNTGEADKIIYLYTEDLGKVVARAKSARKITSKLSGHLEPLNFNSVRLVEKNGFQVVDALSFGKIEVSPTALAFIGFIKEMTFELQPDKKLWLMIKKISETLKTGGKFSYRPLLKILGFGPELARCSSCQSRNVAYFSKSELAFFCRRCAFKMPQNDLVLIE